MQIVGGGATWTPFRWTPPPLTKHPKNVLFGRFSDVFSDGVQLFSEENLSVGPPLEVRPT